MIGDGNEIAQKKVGGAEGIRTPDPHNAIVVLYQLSYDPNRAAKLRVAFSFVKNFPRMHSRHNSGE